MPVSEDVTREMFSLFEERTRAGQSSIELTPLLLLQRIENIGDVFDVDEFRGQFAICRTVMLMALDVTHGDCILVEHQEALEIRFVLPRPGPSQPPD
jgi:hypothetical protein